MKKSACSVNKVIFFDSIGNLQKGRQTKGQNNTWKIALLLDNLLGQQGFNETYDLSSMDTTVTYKSIFTRSSVKLYFEKDSDLSYIKLSEANRVKVLC